jgi:hypothetical protein
MPDPEETARDRAPATPGRGGREAVSIARWPARRQEKAALDACRPSTSAPGRGPPAGSSRGFGRRRAVIGRGRDLARQRVWAAAPASDRGRIHRRVPVHRPRRGAPRLRRAGTSGADRRYVAARGHRPGARTRRATVNDHAPIPSGPLRPDHSEGSQKHPPAPPQVTTPEPHAGRFPRFEPRPVTGRLSAGDRLCRVDPIRAGAAARFVDGCVGHRVEQ